MYKYALINKETNVVDNVILWDGGDSWSAPNTHTAINVEGITIGIGYTYSNETFVAPVTPTPVVDPTIAEKESAIAKLTALGLTEAEIMAIIGR